MDKPTEIRPMATPNSTDDESITTSTASDTLDSWTLVTDKKNSKPANTNPIPIYETEDNIEDLPKYEDLDLETSQSNAKEEQENEPSPDHQADTTSATDEFSDEVSIISESESGDALAPHPFLREHLNLKFTTGEGLDLASLLQQQQQEEQHRLQPKRQTTPPNTPIQFQQVSTMNSDNNEGFRQRKRRSTSVDDSQKKLKHQAEPPVPINESQVSCPLQLPRFKRHVYTFLFYLIVGLMVLGFYGKLGHWPTFIFNNSNSMYVWEKKISDLQHDNNLMRAEIDLLTKQVYYLTTLQDKMNDEKNKQKYRAKNSNRNNGGNNGKIENFDNLDESNTADPTERRNEGFQYEEYSKYPSKKYYKNDNLIMTERYSKHNGKERQYATNNEDNPKRKDEMGENDTIYGNKKDNFNEATGDEKHKDYVNFKKDTSEKNNSKERKYKKSSEDHKDFKEQNYKNDNSKERKYKTSDDDSKEKKYKNDNSKERKYKKSNDDDDSKEYKNDNSKERKYKKQYRNDNNSKEKFNRNVNSKENSQQKQRKFNSGERFDQSGEWHDNLMKQREKARKEREEDMKRAKNWYFNRNEGREEWRNDDSHRR